MSDDVLHVGPCPPRTVVHDFAAAVAQALDHLGDPGPRLTVLVNDPQRHTATSPVLRALAAQLPPGVPRRLLIATGSHRFGESVRSSFAEPLSVALGAAATAWHDAAARDLVHVGRPPTWRGHRWLTDGGALLAIGSVEPHYFAGCTGAHKTLTIGCAAREDIEANHAGAMSPDAEPCRLAGNPVHEGVAEMLARLTEGRRVAAINLVQPGESVCFAAGGEPLRTLRRCAAVAGEVFTTELPDPADAVVAEVTGPLGRSFYQADKGIKNTEPAVRDGGVLVLAAACSDGIGQDHFVSLLRTAPTFDEAARCVAARGYRLGDHKAVRLRRLTDPAARGVRVFAVSDGLTDADLAVLGITRADSVEDALARAGVDPARHRIVRVSDAGNLALTVAD